MTIQMILRRMRHTLIALLVVAGVAPVEADILEQILVKVNGETLTKTDLEQRQILFLRQQRNQRYTQADLSNDAELKKILVEITPQIMEEAIDEMLMVQKGRDLGYKLSDDQFKEVVDRIRKENKIDTEELFQAALKQEGMTMADLRRSLERQMLVSRVQQIEVFGRIGTTEEEARKYYDEHKTEFTTQSLVTIRELMIAVPSENASGVKGVNVGLDEEAAQKAEKARARVMAGEDISRVAAEVSDAPSKANGGLIGPIGPQELAPVFQQTIDKLKVGEVSPVVRGPRGYHVLKLESATETNVLPFEQARDQISEKIFEDKRSDEFEKYMRKLRAEAIIEWKNDELKKVYEQRVGTTAPSKPPMF